MHSPNFPDNYPNKARCRWTLFAPPQTNNLQIRLAFTNFSLTYYTYRGVSVCSNDQVSVWDSIIAEPDTQLARLCGRAVWPQALYSSAGILAVHFDTESGQTATGFEATIDYVNTFPCRANVSVPVNNTGYLISPNFPKAPQTAAQCEWLLGNANKQDFLLEYEEFSVGGDDSAPCQIGRTNTLLIVTGQHNSSGPFCGTTKPPDREVPSGSAID